MRIVLATTVLEKGGVWRHMTDVASGLRAHGHEVEFDLPRPAWSLRGESRDRGFSLRESSVRSPADVWHLHLADTYSRDSLRRLISARRTGTPVVITEHLPRTDASDPSARPSGGTTRPGSWAAKTAFKQFEFSLCDRIIAVSESSRQFLLTRYGLSADKLVTVPNGIRPCNVVSSSPETPARFVAVGSVIAQKGFDLLVEAAALADVPWSVEIVGDGPHRVALQEQRVPPRTVGPLRRPARRRGGGPPVGDGTRHTVAVGSVALRVHGGDAAGRGGGRRPGRRTHGDRR